MKKKAKQIINPQLDRLKKSTPLRATVKVSAKKTIMPAKKASVKKIKPILLIKKKTKKKSPKTAYENSNFFVTAKKTSKKSSKKMKEPTEKFEPAKAGKWETRDPTTMYLRELGYKSLLTAKEEIRIARQVKAGSKAARIKMIESNLRLVVKIARYYCHRGLAFLDLIEEGNLGLMTAVNKFDPERGFRFSTYATWWIRQTIERALMNQSRTVRLPIHVIKELNLYLRAGKKLSAQLNHQATPEEIAEMIDRPVEEIREILLLAPDTVSIDAPVMQDSEKTLVDMIADEANVNPSDLVQQRDMEVHIEQWLHGLSDREREVIIRRFGLQGHDRGTLEEVGEAVGLTRERVRQLQIEGLRKLRHIIESEGVSES